MAVLQQPEGKGTCRASGTGGGAVWLQEDSLVHVGLVAGHRVKRVASLQEQPCQLVGQGPVSELRSRARGRLSPVREHLLLLSVLSRVPAGGHSPAPSRRGRPAGRRDRAWMGLERPLADPWSLLPTGPPRGSEAGQRGLGRGSPGSPPRRRPAAGWAPPGRTAAPGRSWPWAAAAGGVAPAWGQGTAAECPPRPHRLVPRDTL